jgi:rhodanese-related sulfurtransferase
MQHITAPELAAWLADDVAPEPLLLDVRENWEFETCQIAGSTQIPMNLIPIRVSELDDDRESSASATTARAACRWRLSWNVTDLKRLRI